MAPSKTVNQNNSKPKQINGKKKKNKDKVFKYLSSSELSSTTSKQVKNGKVTGSLKTSVRLPSSASDASSNWKTLCSSLKPVHTEGRARYVAKKHQEKLAALENEKNSKPQESANALDSTSTQDAEVWFDDVDPILLDSTEKESSKTDLKIPGLSDNLTKVLALDCEMVGVGSGGVESALARVSIVNQQGDCVYDKFVAPGDEVTDYRTQFSGIRPHNLQNATELGVVCHEVSAILRGRVLVGHGLRNDLDVLMIRHPRSNIRDTSKFKPFRTLVNGATPSLKRLAQQFLGIEIQTGEHSSVQDAQAAMRLYAMFRQQWEADLSTRRSERKNRISKGKQSKKVDPK